MKHKLVMLLLGAVTATVSACADHPGRIAVNSDKAAVTSILLIGDTGYDYDWLEQDDYEDKFTAREFVIKELDDWLEDKLPVHEFRLTPMH